MADGRRWTLCAWLALALACELPLGAHGQPRAPSKSQQSKRQKRRDGSPATWMAEELCKRVSIGRYFERVPVYFRLQRPPVFGWSAVETRAALTRAAV